MKKNLSILLIGSLAILGTLVLVYPMLKSDAQISQEKNEKQDTALQNIRREPLSNTFYEILLNKEKSKNVSWEVTKAFCDSKRAKPEVGTLRVSSYKEWYFMVFEHKKVEVRVSISRFESDELAIEAFNSFSPSYGRVEKLKEYGDEGRKVIVGNGKFGNLSFRKGEFNVSIGCDSKKIAGRFAGYVLKTLENY